MEGINMPTNYMPLRRAATLARAIVANQLDSDSEDSHSAPDADAQLPTHNRRASATSMNRKTAKTRQRSTTMHENQSQPRPKTKSARSSPSPRLTTSRSMSSLASPNRSTFQAAKSIQISPRSRPEKPTPASLPPLIIGQTNDLGELSDLTPLSSDCSSANPDIIDLTEPSPLANAPASSPSRLKILPVSKPKKEATKSTWTVGSLRTYVWVLIEPNTWRVCEEDGDEEDDTERLWWPAKIISQLNIDIPLKVKLFGLATTALSIKIPSERNVLPRDQNYRTRFLIPAFVLPSTRLPNAASTKKQRIAREVIEDKWKAAVAAMKNDEKPIGEDDEMDSDDFPEATNNLFHFLTANTPSVPEKQSISQSSDKIPVKSKGKRKRNAASDTSADEEHEVYVNKKRDKKEADWFDQVDDELDLPGEHILGRTTHYLDSDYWPGRLVKYIPPTKSKTPGKYLVHWLDGTETSVLRSWFYTTEQDEFATCKLGKFESALVEVQNDEDNETTDQPGLRLAERSPSPDPVATVSNGEEFSALSIRQQFVHTKEILKAILNNNYEPTNQRHARFIKGGKHRQSVVDDASLRGKMDPRDVEHLQIYIREWCLRDGGRAVALRGDSDFISVDEGALGDIQNTDNPETNPEIHTKQDKTMEPHLSGMIDSGDTRCESPLLTEHIPSSPPPMPPSSFPSAGIERESSSMSVLPDLPEVEGTLERSANTTATLVISEPGATVTNQSMKKDATDLNFLDNDAIIVPFLSANRQRGCEEFESLSELEKVDYCVNILLPEAVRQILLWRNGDRTSIELLSSENEKVLYEQGSKLLCETDWVNDVMRYRKAMENMVGRKEKKALASTSRRQNSTGRPRLLRTNIVIPNYQE